MAGTIKTIKTVEDGSAALDWRPHAERLAAVATVPGSGWQALVAGIPRHPFVPCWWETTDQASDGNATWTRRDGTDDPDAWLRTAYANRSPITQVAGMHADLTGEPAVTGRPTSSATMPQLLVIMYGHANLTDGCDLLDVGTGSGYGTALLARRLGDRYVTSIDVDQYLTVAAAERLATVGLHPPVITGDATGPLPASQTDDGCYDRIVATVALPSVPASWLAALRPGGRLVTTIAGTAMTISANRMPDGGAVGQVEGTQAGFMPTRTNADDYPARLLDRPEYVDVRTREGETVTRSPYPVVDVGSVWELETMLGLTNPGTQHHYACDEANGIETALLLHRDGSWARATAGQQQPTTVHQGGPRRLWDDLDRVRRDWQHAGDVPAYGARVRIDPDGTCHLAHGRWTATIG